ncbi:MAG: serine/threonine protein kinase [Deltaproteobacteria bacterium]|nr:serine/threonine protein kinase [Deltaproteobacteria bacterium]
MFGRYLLVQRLSRGGMGEIFLAKHGLAGFEKLAVIKKVLPHLAADAQFISRFVDEAQVAIKLQHVNVAQVFEVGRVGDEYFLALEYVEGRDLRRTLAHLNAKKQRLPVDLALFIGREMANGLAYAHRRTSSDGASLNLVHCDISPPNVLVSFEGETKVIDFGIAKSAIRGTATDPKMGFGKFGYMAPEQLIRGGIVDHRTDIYAAGVVLYELLTGTRLYEAGPEPDYRALAKKVAKGEHDLPSKTDKALAPYDDLVATALRPKGEDRYQSAAEFRDAIQQALVSVNPTISTDQLGAYMRELFAEEMTAQRELHDRVAKAHLEDFQDQLTSQHTSTVSFAMSLPLPPEVPPARKTPPPRPSQRTRPPTAQTDILPQQPPLPPAVPTAVVPTEDLSLADGTGTIDHIDLRPASRSKKPLAILLAAGIFVAGGLVFAFTQRGGDEIPATKVAGDPPAAPPAKITVEPITQPPSLNANPSQVEQHVTVEAVEPPAPPANTTTTTTTTTTTPTKVESPPHADKHPATTTAKKHDVKQAKQAPPKTETPGKTPELTREAVIAKFRAVSRQYDAFKQQNGGRLDGDWNDLASFIQYHPDDLAEFSRRIDAFRARLK